MEVRVKVPLKADIVYQGIELKIAAKSQSWTKTDLGDYASKSGVYVHHSNGIILYVGKTTIGEYGNFGERLRREFQETSSSNSQLFQLLAKQKHPVKTIMFDLDDIDMMVNPGPIQLARERKALIMEQILIGIFQPIGNKV